MRLFRRFFCDLADPFQLLIVPDLHDASVSLIGDDPFYSEFRQFLNAVFKMIVLDQGKDAGQIAG